MFRKALFLATVVALSVTVSVRADQISTNVTMPVSIAGAANAGNLSNVGVVSGTEGNGISFTTTTQPLTVPGGAVYATGSNNLSTYTQTNGSGFIFKGDNVTVSYAIQGTQTTTIGGGLSASFQKGVFAIYDTHAVAWNNANPATWGPNTAGATLLYSGTIRLGPGNTIVGINPAGQPQSATAGAAQNQAAFNLNVPSVAGNFVFSHLVNNMFLTPNPSDGVQIHVTETNAQGTVSPGDAALDANFAAVAGLDTQAFSTLHPFADTNFTNLYNTGNPQGTGDTAQTIAFNIFPVITPPGGVVPEPTSMLIWAGIAAGIGIYRRGRSSRLKKV